MLQKHIHKVKFYPSADDFTQALLVMLVTNIMSALWFNQVLKRCQLVTQLVSVKIGNSFDPDVTFWMSVISCCPQPTPT